MSKKKLFITEELLKSKERELEKYKFVNKNFPGAEIIPMRRETRFASKLVNSNCTDFDFRETHNSLFVIPYFKLIFKFEDKEEVIKVHSIPKMSRLAYIPWRRLNKKRIMKFSKLAFNIKRNNFTEAMLTTCKVRIMKFIQSKDDCEMDTKHLDPRLKKLLTFS